MDRKSAGAGAPCCEEGIIYLFPAPFGLSVLAGAARKAHSNDMKRVVGIFAFLIVSTAFAADLRLERDGTLRCSNAPPNAIVCLDGTNALPSSPTNWPALRNYFTDPKLGVTIHTGLTNPLGFFRLRVFELSGTNGFSNFVAAYSTMTTVAGAGGATGSGVNKWQAGFENGPATNALLSRPHIALGDDAGNIYIADKDAHGIRKVRTDGTIVTVAGTSVAGNGPDYPTNATSVALNQPNGLWVDPDGAFYILDLANFKVRKVDTNGMARTLFFDGGLVTGRGLWVGGGGAFGYYCSGTVLRKWTALSGITDYVSGFTDLGNISENALTATDRGAHRVYRIVNPEVKILIAGNGATGPGIDGTNALDCPLDQVRGVWSFPGGGYLLATDNGSQIWYVDSNQKIHLLVNGSSANTSHSGDGAYFYQPAALKVSKVRQVTLDHEGNILIAEHDAGYVRKIRFLPR